MRLSCKSLSALLLAAGIGVLLLVDGNQRLGLPLRSGDSLHGQAPGLASGDDRVLKVVQFNIDRGQGRDGRTDLSRTAECLEGADLIGINEAAGGFLGRSASQVETLGERLGLAWLFAASERRWWHESFGNGILSALPSSAWTVEPLPHRQSKARDSLASVTFDWNGSAVTLLVTHIDRGPDRDSQLDFLAERFASTSAPKILLADLNVNRSHPVLAAWSKDPALVMTTGPLDPEAPVDIDWIVAEGFGLVESWRCDIGGSDHPAVGAELEARF